MLSFGRDIIWLQDTFIGASTCGTRSILSCSALCIVHSLAVSVTESSSSITSSLLCIVPSLSVIVMESSLLTLPSLVVSVTESSEMWARRSIDTAFKDRSAFTESTESAFTRDKASATTMYFPRFINQLEIILFYSSFPQF